MSARGPQRPQDARGGRRQAGGVALWEQPAPEPSTQGRASFSENGEVFVIVWPDGSVHLGDASTSMNLPAGAAHAIYACYAHARR